MAEAAVKIFEREGDALEREVLDRVHLARMTFNDRNLEREVLQLFVRQAELLMQRIHGSEPAAIATLAHILNGSAAGIGAGPQRLYGHAACWGGGPGLRGAAPR